MNKEFANVIFYIDYILLSKLIFQLTQQIDVMLPSFTFGKLADFIHWNAHAFNCDENIPT